MKLFMLGSVGVVCLLAVGCGSDDASPSGGAGAGGMGSTTVTPSDCAAVGKLQKSLVDAVGCSDNSATIVAGCKALYAAKACTTEWEALINCISPKASSQFVCDADNEVQLKDGVCTAERAAFDTCTGS